MPAKAAGNSETAQAASNRGRPSTNETSLARVLPISSVRSMGGMNKAVGERRKAGDFNAKTHEKPADHG